MGDSMLVSNWLNGRQKVHEQICRRERERHKVQKLLDKTDIKPMRDHLDLLELIQGGRLALVVKKKHQSWSIRKTI